MCSKKFRGLVGTECLLLVFATVFLTTGLCQNAEPKGTFGSVRTNSREREEESYDSASLDQRFETSRWEGSSELIGTSLDDKVEAPASSSGLTDIGSAEAKAESLPVRSSVLSDNKKKGTSEKENRDDESTRKTIVTAVSTQCNSGRGSKRRSCSGESRLKKRRRYTSGYGRGSSAKSDTDLSVSNRIRGSSSGRTRRIQDRGQVRAKNRGRKRNGKRTGKQGEGIGRTRSRKNNKFTSKISAEAPAALHQPTSVKVRDNTEERTRGFIGKKFLSSNVTVENVSVVGKRNDEVSKMMKNVDADNAFVEPSVMDKPEVTRRRHEENVEHEFSKNLEKEILWARTEVPDVRYEAATLGPDKKNVTASILNPEIGDSTNPVKSGRFDAAKMLGYSRSTEDLPILDLENEVLARTLEDYNAYLKNGGKTTKLLRRGNEWSEKESNSRVGDDVPIPVRRPVYRHDLAKENLDEWNSQEENQPRESGEAEIPTSSETGDVLKGDLTCINGTFIPAPLARHALIKYVKSSIPGHEYLEADYECIPGFYMASSNSRLLCKNRRWIGELPNCKSRRGQSGPCAESSCDQVCNEVDGQAKCSCYKGFRLDGHQCIDTDECEIDKGGCEYKCVNTPGSYRCECPQGMKRGEDKFTCMDINECLLNNGHGPCQDTCRNLEGSYACSCEGLAGTILSSDNHTCQDAGPCAVNNAGCSHSCLSTMGRVFCLCPDGFMLADDWKTCQDVDECYVPDLQTEICHYGCINTPGSYRCVDPTELNDQPIQDTSVTCFTGYEIATGSSCVDINECNINNGGCSEVCENTEGSYFCACDGDEKALSVDGKSCTDINDLACPPLDPARRGYLMCSRETTPRMWHDDRRVANRPGTKCYLKCPSGYQLHGEYELTCQGDGTWDGPKHGECVKYSKPRLECPKDVIAEIPPDRDEAFVTFDQPSTDLDWFRYVRSKPSWGTRLEASLKPGLHLVTFSARHPVSKKQASCVLRIIVKEGEAPKVNNCPSDIAGKNGTAITWMEPTFTDNVRVTHTITNEKPGKYFGIGVWKIVYEASDEAGWTTRCVFSVVVHQD